MERPEGMQPGLGQGAHTHDRLESWHLGLVLALVDQTMSRVPPPAMRTLKRRNQLSPRRPTEPGRGRRAKAGWCHSVYSTIVPTVGQVEMLYHVERDVNRLENLPAHVQAVQSPIRCIDKVDRAEPEVGRAHELCLRIRPA